MNFYRDIRYLDYQDGEHNTENVGSIKLFFRGNTGKAEIYIKKLPCKYPVECKVSISQEGTAHFSRWVEIDKTDWQKSLEFVWELPCENVEATLFISEGRKICERKKQIDKTQELETLYEEAPPVQMQQISKDEIESVPMRDKQEVKENEYYMSRLSELGELSEELKALEHNSFLLHGYFNYRHLLIRKEGDRFVVGVPGNYYYREEMVAAMFGFPNFVPAGKGKEPGDSEEASLQEEEKKVGEFGYYFG